MASLLDSVISMRSLSRSSGAGRSFWDGCDDGCDERKDDRELALACRANDCSGTREGEGRADGERERLPMLRPLTIVRVAAAGMSWKKKRAYLWLNESRLTWTDEFPSLAAGSGLENPDISRGELFVMARWLKQSQDVYHGLCLVRLHSQRSCERGNERPCGQCHIFKEMDAMHGSGNSHSTAGSRRERLFCPGLEGAPLESPSVCLGN